MKKKHIVFWIIFPIIMLLITGIMLFYIDIANGPLVCLILEIVLLIVFIFGRILFLNSKIIKRLILWGLFILCNFGIVMMSHPSVGLKSADYYNSPSGTIEINTGYGRIKGVVNKDNTVRVFAGIPYAKAPIGNLRWKEPQDIEPWTDVKDCTKFKPKSYQPEANEITSSLVDIYAQGRWVPDYSNKMIEEMSEDSLYLNIWRPNDYKDNLPVLVYIHGGSLTTGSSAYLDYNGEEMAKTGVIMVTISYRLGIFGYFAHEALINESLNHTTGNYGLLDQIKALEWINNNIKWFGGDKNNITIAGESAGSSSVSAICTSPLAKGLFKRAIGESSSLVVKRAPHTYRTMADALKTGNNIMKEFKASNINELRNISASELVKTQYRNDCITLDGYALTKDPYQVYLDNENNEEALLNGYNVKEADAFVVPKYLFSPTNKDNIKERLAELFDDNTINKIMALYKNDIERDAFSAFNEIISVWWFMYPHESWSRMAYNNGEDVYRYQFTKTNGYYGTYHSGELIYAFGNVKKTPYKYRYNDNDIKLSNKMLKYWSNFAKYGNPNEPDFPNWELWNSNDNRIIEFGDNLGMIKDKYLNLYKIFDEFLDV